MNSVYQTPVQNHASRYYPTKEEANIGFKLDEETESHEAAISYRYVEPNAQKMCGYSGIWRDFDSVCFGLTYTPAQFHAVLDHYGTSKGSQP